MYLLSEGFLVAWDGPSPCHFKFIDIVMAGWFLGLRNLVVHILGLT